MSCPAPCKDLDDLRISPNNPSSPKTIISLRRIFQKRAGLGIVSPHRAALPAYLGSIALSAKPTHMIVNDFDPTISPNLPSPLYPSPHPEQAYPNHVDHPIFEPGEESNGLFTKPRPSHSPKHQMN